MGALFLPPAAPGQQAFRTTEMHEEPTPVWYLESCDEVRGRTE
ncbi:hypothetical protein RFM41_15015 [Mesorhizobium sp. VK25A]|uniref:Uncharacterized protein n=1 Tax=Mesorhizobium vachelliae TaxID=3072309 RepID=A0ABU5A626_9HYPH|nr:MULTISPECIES: hypothetical protein [unclassified Mesorhizobium]MDX8533138.1 hypothetical protein [Mesorhizobium sp. VK25D]MDX8545057.1 hypothetical protein [Mesorhizobium sp. VK25A]